MKTTRHAQHRARPTTSACATASLAILASLASLASLVSLVSLLACGMAHAQDKKKPTAKVSPDALDLGSLRQGARVEANFLVYWRDRSKRGKPVKVEVPAFVRVNRSETTLDKVRGAKTRVWITISTKGLGALEGAVLVRCDGTTIQAPVRAVVLPRDPVSPRVLVAETPFAGYSTSSNKTFAAWHRVVATGKLEVHYLNVPAKGSVFDARLLQRMDVVLVGDTCLVRMTKEDVAMLQGFVCGGGRLVVAASRFFAGTVATANKLISSFGMRMEDVEAGGRAFRELTDDEIKKHPLTAKVLSVTVRRLSPTKITNKQSARILVQVPDAPEAAVIAWSRTESGGEVVTLGPPLWWLWVGHGPDNTRLLRNLLTRERRQPVKRR